MDLDIKGLRVLVTAGANGIGRAIAQRFAGDGARVHICDVDEAALAAFASSDPAITSTRCDVSDRAAVKNLFADATAKLGGLDDGAPVGLLGPVLGHEHVHVGALGVGLGVRVQRGQVDRHAGQAAGFVVSYAAISRLELRVQVGDEVVHRDLVVLHRVSVVHPELGYL